MAVAELAARAAVAAAPHRFGESHPEPPPPPPMLIAGALQPIFASGSAGTSLAGLSGLAVTAGAWRPPARRPPTLLEEIERRQQDAPARHRLLMHKQPLSRRAVSAESMLAYHRARWMDARVGRFEGLDPDDGHLLHPLDRRAKFGVAGLAEDDARIAQEAGLANLFGRLQQKAVLVAAAAVGPMGGIAKSSAIPPSRGERI